MWIIENPNEPFGQIRYDVEKNFAYIDISTVPLFRRQGLAKHLILETLPLLIEKSPGVNCLIAKVRSDNIASKKLFGSIGFARIKEGGIETWAIPVLKAD